MKMPRIELSPKLKKELADDYGITTQAVRNALKYFTNSEQAQNIRKDAIKLLQREAKKVSISVNEK